MKAIQILALTLLISGTLPAQSATPLEFWQFNDAAGTDLKAAANSGTIATAWDLATDTKGDVTNGSALVLSGDSGVYTRRTAPAYSTPLATTGAYLLEMTLAGWTIDSSTFASNSNLRFVAGDSALGFNVAELQFRYQEVDVDGVVTPTVKLQYRVNTGSGFALVTVAQYTNLASSTPVTWAVVLDYDNATAQGYLDGVAVGEPSPFAPADPIHGIVLGKAGAGGWVSPGTSVLVDSMGLSATVVEVPDTWYGYAIVDGLADTGDWMGWLHVAYDPWIYSFSLSDWLYMPQQEASSGAWVYVNR